MFDRGGRVPMLLLSVSHRFSKCADAIRARRRPVPRSAPLLRHPAARAWGASEGRQRGLGHSSISITIDTYSHVMPSMSQVAADAIDAVLGE